MPRMEQVPRKSDGTIKTLQWIKIGAEGEAALSLATVCVFPFICVPSIVTAATVWYIADWRLKNFQKNQENSINSPVR